MDDNYIVNRIVDILQNGSQNLLLGNINSPRPGSICQVSTDYGIKDAYNINCTYPGDVIVVWDKDEEQYYCFTNKPSTVINSRQLAYRKYKAINKNIIKERYILYTGTVIYNDNGVTSDRERYQRPDRVEATNIYFEKVLRKLNPNITKLYIAIKDENNLFWGLGISDSVSYVLNNLPNTLEDSLLRYLISQDIEIILVKDTELDTVEGTLWIPYVIAEEADEIPTDSIKIIKKIASSYGVLFQAQFGSSNILGNIEETPIIKKYLDIFYNPFHTPIEVVVNEQIRTYMYSNLPNYLDIQINSVCTALFNIDMLPAKDVLGYSLKVAESTGIITSNTKYASVFYWQN